MVGNPLLGVRVTVRNYSVGAKSSSPLRVKALFILKGKRLELI